MSRDALDLSKKTYIYDDRGRARTFFVVKDILYEDSDIALVTLAKLRFSPKTPEEIVSKALLNKESRSISDGKNFEDSWLCTNNEDWVFSKLDEWLYG